MPQVPRSARRSARKGSAACLAGLVLLAGLATTGVAQELPASASPALSPLVSLEWHGELRLRAERLGGVQLVDDTEATPRIGLQHLGIPRGAVGSGGTFGTGDLRLRLRPVLHVGEWSRVHAQLDVAQGITLGASPAARNILERMTAETGQQPIDGVGVRRLWAEARLFGLGELVVGRAPDHFGLGILRNEGGGLEGDFQSDVDRVGIRAEVLGLRWMIARDTMASWPPVRFATDGPQFALEDRADVIRWVLEVHGGKPHALRGLSWEAAVLYQTQDLGLALEHAVDPAGPDRLASTNCLATGECAGVVPRGASIVTPQVAIDWSFGRVRLEAEAALIYGTLDDTDPAIATDTSKTIISGGAAARARWRRGRGTMQLDSGFATGESDGGFGVLDTDNFRAGGLPDAPHRDTLTGFRFHREYRVDGLLFRDIIGAVANAWYVKPAYRFWILETGPDSGVHGEAGVLAAGAMSRGATPGASTLLGLEPELRLDYRSTACGAGPCAEAQLRGTVLLPGGGFDAGADGPAAETAWRVEALVRMGF